MPTAPRRCAKPDCRNLQPCQIHPQGRWRVTYSRPLPRNWKALCREVRRLSGGICRKCGRLANPGEVDHIINRANGGPDHISNLQLLCVPCHRVKTRKERKEANRKRR